MHINFTPDQESLRTELRDYFSALIPPDLAVELEASQGIGPVVKRLVRSMLIARAVLGSEDESRSS